MRWIDFPIIDKRSWARGAMLLAVVVAAASCGGGGGYSSSGADTQAPAAAISAPANFASGIPAGMLTFSANATDNVGVASVEFQVDGVAAGAAQTSAPYSVSVNTNDYASGQHVLRVRASDAAGNQSAWTSVTVSFGGNRTQPAGFTRNPIYITGLIDATAFAQAPGGRLFVAKQTGAMRVVTNGGMLLPTPFMTLTVDFAGERGLLGVAFHPNFATNNFVYAYYTVPGVPSHNRVSQFTAIGDVVVPGSEVPLVNLPNLSASNHNGGAIHFGADGKLYVAVGDNAFGPNSQSLSTPLGKMLRFNDDGTIPSDNPFFGTQFGLARAIWAYGLRNPFTFAVQPGTGRIHINDVGEVTWEEINIGAAGANYGWPNTEGPTTAAGVTGPLLAYRHSPTNPPGSGSGGFFTGCAITGGAFYPDSGPFPAEYRGSYFFADLCTSFVARLDLSNDNATYSFGAVTGNPVDMLVASDGALLVLTRGTIERFSSP